MALFDIVALEWFLEKNLRVCLESPDAMEANLIQNGWHERMVLYARAIMREMAEKAKNGIVWRAAVEERQAKIIRALAEPPRPVYETEEKPEEKQV
jgi:hypothetical protein